MAWQQERFAAANGTPMLTAYRTWLESELKLLGNASHHAYSFGQANMAKRAIERLDHDLKDKSVLLLGPGEATALLALLDMLALNPEAPLSPALSAIRSRLQEPAHS